jgi:hypothetical protein
MAARQPQWSGPGHLNQVHIWWYRALFHLALWAIRRRFGNFFDCSIRATQRPLPLSLTNAVALLWRLDTLGCYTDNRWQEQGDLCS